MTGASPVHDKDVRSYASELIGPRHAPRPGWKRDAACSGDERFYDRERATPAVIAHQRRVCGSCPVAADCLLDALAHERVEPAWQVSTRGGLLATERRILNTHVRLEDS